MSYFIYHGKRISKVGLLGLGISNLAVLQYISKRYTDTEIRIRSESFTDTSGLGAARTFFGKDSLSDICEDILFLSPSARRDRDEIKNAEARGVTLLSDAEFFFDMTDAEIYGVTGSDGKSTTSYLSAALIDSPNENCIPIGNIGVPFTSRLDDTGKASYVAELSSFQLMYMKPRTRRCVITNITENHLNWHTSFEEYINAKRGILENCRERILNYDCEICRSFMHEHPLFAVFSAKYSEEELRGLVRADNYITVRGDFICSSDAELLDIRDIRARGAHNILNFEAALAMSLGLCEKDKAAKVAKEFTGLRHRCEHIGCFCGVDYYDSSIDSTPTRTAATLAATDGRVIIILGGRSKGLDFSPLIPHLQKKVRHIVLTGECKDEIKEALLAGEANIPFTDTECFTDAVMIAVGIARRGDTVLLSPAATSYDEFSSFDERGERFKKIIRDFHK